MSRLISEMQDRPLGLYERLLLRTHMSVCDTCVRYDKQLKLMRRAMGRWENYSDEP